MKNLHYTQNDTYKGQLRVNVATELGFFPVEDAKITLSYSGDPTNTLEELTTDISGQTETVDLAAPPLEYSMQPSEGQPYSQYTIRVDAPGYRPVNVIGIAVLPDTTAVQNIRLSTVETAGTEPQNIVITENTLFGDFPPKIPESEIKPVNETGEIVLSRVVIPEYVVVHDGPPSDSRAADYYVRYRDYIKNVASSEIYATWPDASLRANILAIMSFTLNRVYTEWYRNKGYNFTITSSTAYDHKFVYGRNIYSNISQIVDEIFNNYLSRPGVSQPILTQYCDGQQVTCPNWMTQWGSKYLADQGYSAIEILRYYYGSSMYINSADEISGIPASWPGTNLTVGSRGDKVRQMQEQLNRIAQNYPAIPRITADGIFGPATRDAVMKFQSIFGLTPDGIVGFKTWYKISEIYVAVSRIAELYQ